MKLIIRIILIGVGTYFLSPFFSWWLCMVVAFAVCALMPSSGLIAFIAGFLGVGLTWLGMAWQLDVANQSVFTSKIATIMQLEEPIFLVLASGLVGALAGAFAALSGTYFRKIFIKSKSKSYYS